MDLLPATSNSLIYQFNSDKYKEVRQGLAGNAEAVRGEDGGRRLT
jgi:hypothetical protein